MDDKLVLVFTTFATFIATINVVTGFIKNLFKTKGTPKLFIQIMSWIIGVILALIAFKLNLGFFSELNLVESLIYGVGASLASNGVARTGLLKTIIKISISILRKNQSKNNPQ